MAAVESVEPSQIARHGSSILGVRVSACLNCRGVMLNCRGCRGNREMGMV